MGAIEIRSQFRLPPVGEIARKGLINLVGLPVFESTIARTPFCEAGQKSLLSGDG